MKKHTHFPLFVDTRGQKALIIGGGNIALRRIKTLCAFCFNIVVVAPEINEEIRQLAEEFPITMIKAPYDKKYLSETFIAVAATDNRSVNHAVGRDCKEKNIPVSVADCKEECTFFFPAIIPGETVIGICGDGTDHKEVSGQAKAIRQWLMHKGIKAKTEKIEKH